MSTWRHIYVWIKLGNELHWVCHVFSYRFVSFTALVPFSLYLDIRIYGDIKTNSQLDHHRYLLWEQEVYGRSLEHDWNLFGNPYYRRLFVNLKRVSGSINYARLETWDPSATISTCLFWNHSDHKLIGVVGFICFIHTRMCTNVYPCTV